jgi:hypothetical protein
MTENDDIARIMRGERVAFEAQAGGNFRLWFAAPPEDFWFISGTDDHLAWSTRWPLERACIEAQLPTSREVVKIVSPEALPVALWARARSLPARARALLDEVRAGRWLPVETGWWFHDEALGLLHVDLQGAHVHAVEQPEERLAPLLWGMQDLASISPPEALDPRVRAAIGRAAADLSDVLGGARALVYRPPPYVTSAGLAVVMAIGTKVLWLNLNPDGSLPERVALNPHAAVTEFRRLRSQILATHFGRTEFDRRFACQSVPSEMGPLVPMLEVGLRRTRREVVEAYLTRIREGLTISGGPTTDDTWTVSFSGQSFWISGYRPGSQGTERTLDPLSESRLREMLENYAMFGLRDLPE